MTSDAKAPQFAPDSPRRSRGFRSSARLSICDAELLIQQYNNRNLPEVALNAEQRKVWANEATTVLRDLVTHLAAEIGPTITASEPYVIWNEEMRADRRPVTYKITVKRPR